MEYNLIFWLCRVSRSEGSSLAQSWRDSSMTLDPKEVILRRLSRELTGVKTVFLGSGLPQLVRPRLLPGTVCVDASSNGSTGQVDVVVVEADRVTSRGDLVLISDNDLFGGSCKRWIAAMSHTDSTGHPRLVKASRDPVTRLEQVNLVITEMGVIEVSPLGLILREVAPGLATDDVKLKTNASLHVADDIRLMDL